MICLSERGTKGIIRHRILPLNTHMLPVMFSEHVRVVGWTGAHSSPYVACGSSGGVVGQPHCVTTIP